jgi:hypothetical protein
MPYQRAGRFGPGNKIKGIETLMRNKSIFCFCLVLSIMCGVFPGISFSQPLQLNQAVLDRAIDLAGNYLLTSQKEDGNFVYEYNFLTHQTSTEDNQVRQAGALWGLALIHKEQPSPRTFLALERGFRFFKTHSHLIQDARYIVYPGEKSGSLGTIALVALALMDFIPTIQEKKIKEQYKDDLKQYLSFLLLARQKEGQFYSSYDLKTGRTFGDPSPYFDGEALLALTKAVRHSGFKQWESLVLESASKMYQTHVREALKKDADSSITKGFYQWGSMAFFEIYAARWKNHQQFGRYVVDLAHWMIDVHQILKRPKNTAYAYEGLCCALEIARLENNEQAAQNITNVIDRGLFKLISWQKGSPLEIEFLKRVSDPKALGAVINGEHDPALRIDVTQHQLHAMILARRYLYPAIQNQPQAATENKRVSSREIEDALLLAGKYLKNAVKDDGSLVYEYFPPANPENSQYNMLRHAGTICAMVDLYELNHDKALLEKIQKAIPFLLGNLRNVRMKNHEALVAIDNGSIKLGANALAILALTKYMDAVQTREYLETVQKLARWIQATQSPQGQFLIHKQDLATQEISDFVSGFYPGEAIYALTLLYKIDRNNEWLDTAEKAAGYLIYVRDGGKSTIQLSHDHWLLYGLNELYRLRPHKIYYEHALKISSAILSAQRKDPAQDGAGSFDTPARSTPTATRVEGLCAVYRLVRDFGTKRELDLLFDGICLGIQFQLKTQVTNEMASDRKWPLRAVGGFQDSPDIPGIRIDYVQHNVSSLLGAYRILKER